ncbi:hypothetical protein R69746_08817 [Paraburkholderia aspalathi]|nr:hypothetical protein R69746_08817 [Paraburkholderia aspalathi]
MRRREPVGRLETHPAAHLANSLGRDRKAVRRRNNRRSIGHQDLASQTDAAPTLSPDVRSGAPVRVNCCMAGVLCRWSSAFIKERRCPEENSCGIQSTGRLLVCARCRAQVLICGPCDRGNRYCRDCTKEARRVSVREAGRRYQRSRRGRFAHAARSRRHRARRKIVTHHGSPAPPANDLRFTHISGKVGKAMPQGL